MTKQTTWREAIEKVLREAGQPLRTSEIASRIVEQGLKKATATPPATVGATLSGSLKSGDGSPFKKVAPGVYGLRTAVESPGTPEPAAEPAAVVSAFGVYWKRSDVDWKGKQPKLIGEFQSAGVAKTKLPPVDFGGQHGVYLLHDHREVVYVGRTTTGTLGTRLRDHTRDRLQGRWNRFSWFGFRPVAPDGRLQPKVTILPADYGMDRLITVVEAILIEALEPRQNRAAGELGGQEYRQVPDTSLGAMKILETLITQRSP